MLGQSADAGNAEEGLQLIEQARFVLLYEQVSGLRHPPL